MPDACLVFQTTFSSVCSVLCCIYVYKSWTFFFVLFCFSSTNVEKAIDLMLNYISLRPCMLLDVMSVLKHAWLNCEKGSCNCLLQDMAYK